MPKIEFFLRCFHMFMGILWLSQLYFLSFVGSSVRSERDESSRRVISSLLRWASVTALVSGAALFGVIYLYTPDAGWSFALFQGEPSGGLRWISWGMMFGLIMGILVAFVVRSSERALKVSTYLSGPTLACMLAASHSDFSYGTLILASILSLAAIKAADALASFARQTV